MNFPRTWAAGPVAIAGVAAGVAGVLAATYEGPAALAGGIAILGVVGGLARPAFGLLVLAILCIAAPFFVIPVRIGVQPTVVDIVLVAAISGTAVRVLSGRPIPAPGWIWICLGGQIVLMVAAILAGWPGSRDVQAVQYGVKLVLATTVPLWALAWCTSRQIWRLVPSIVTIAVGLQSAIAISLHLAADRGADFLAVLALGGYPSGDIQRFLPDQVTTRATGMLVDPNVLGVTLAAAIPFVLAWTFGGTHARIMGIIVIALVVCALWFSISRGAWIAAFSAVICWTIWTRRLVAVLMLMGGILLILVPIPIPALGHLRTGFLGGDPSSALRLEELQHAVMVIGRYPWLGVGFGDTPHPDVFAGVSNAWLWIAERAGVFAAFASLSVLAGSMIVSARAARHDAIARTAFASLVGIGMASLFDHHIVSFPHVLILIGFVVALAVGSRVSRAGGA